MATLQSAADKWQRKTQNAGSKWAAGFGSGNAVARFNRGMAQFLGISEGAVSASDAGKEFAIASGKAQEFAASYQAGVTAPDAKERYMAGLRRAFGG